MNCPGPGGRGWVGLRSGPCALERGAGLVVLDQHPSGRGFTASAPPCHLPVYYADRGHTLVVLADEDGTEPANVGGGMVCSRLLTRGELAESIQSTPD